jgi:hypothetical protein
VEQRAECRGENAADDGTEDALHGLDGRRARVRLQDDDGGDRYPVASGQLQHAGEQYRGRGHERDA